MNSQKFTAALGDEVVTIETGKLAQQAGGAVTVRCGDTLLLVTATMARTAREGIDFFPLTVDFEERLYAAGRIPGSFFRREGRPTESSILIMRLTDRPMRPLFPKGLRNDVQIVITPLSQDEEHQSDILSIIGASAALTISDIPFDGPVGAMRVGYIDGEIVINPPISQMEHSALDLRLAGSADAVLMVEAGANEVSEAVMVEALRRGHEAIQDMLRAQNEMRERVGKPKLAFTPHTLPDELREIIRQQVGARLPEAIYGATSKQDLNERLRNLRNELHESLDEKWDAKQVRAIFEEVERDIIRKRTIEEGVRADLRDPYTIRSLSAEVGLLPRAHGSGLFTRGETQVLSVATLGTPREEQMLDDLSPDETKRYIHHYNFPPYSTGEASFMRGPKRREIGHGALAERALQAVLPDNGEFPYTIRVVSEA
ncbi:MAG: polyribonucleotide nucleotidyltransferase, partial [Chloroflexi bacterium]|nr:polyribonucleotide nucleotidyltransferase [Chloroflexota bacterium]